MKIFEILRAAFEVYKNKGDQGFLHNLVENVNEARLHGKEFAKQKYGNLMGFITATKEEAIAERNNPAEAAKSEAIAKAVIKNVEKQQKNRREKTLLEKLLPPKRSDHPIYDKLDQIMGDTIDPNDIVLESTGGVAPSSPTSAPRPAVLANEGVSA